MSPLPNTRVIHPDWSGHHQPTAEATMTGTCSIYDGASGPEPWPPVEGWTPDGTPLAVGLPCRVQALNATNTGVQAEQVQGVRQYLVTVPLHQAPEITPTDQGPVVIVHTGDDPMASGLRLRIVDEQHGTLAFERDYVAVHNQTQN